MITRSLKYVPQSVITLFTTKLIILSPSMNGLFTTFLGYALGAIPVVVLANARSLQIRIVVTALVCFVLGSLVLSAQFPDNILLLLGASVSIACTYAQVESWKMVSTHRAKEKKNI